MFGNGCHWSTVVLVVLFSQPQAGCGSQTAASLQQPCPWVEAGEQCSPGALWPGAGEMLGDEAIGALPGLGEEGAIRARGRHGGGGPVRSRAGGGTALRHGRPCLT